MNTFPPSPERISAATLSSLIFVKEMWPLLCNALKERDMLDRPTVVAAAATAGVESHFKVVQEIGEAAYFERTYGKRPDYEVDDHGLWKWRGKGIIQLTGKDNHKKYGDLTGLDLINHPELALVPVNAARIFAAYFKDHGCNVWANRGHWRRVRKLVNGGYNGYDQYIGNVWRLIEVVYT